MAIILPIFSLANLNRESACFISVSGFLLQFKLGNNSIIILKKTRILLSILLHKIIWTMMRSYLSWLYQDNPGFLFEEPHSMSDFFYPEFGMGDLIGQWIMLHGSYPSLQAFGFCQYFFSIISVTMVEDF